MAAGAMSGPSGTGVGGGKKPSVLVLGGGPDAERPVSLVSAGCVGAALKKTGEFEVIERTIDRITAAELRALPGDAVFPVLHGSFGEGGPLQDLLEQQGRPYVGAGPSASRLAMDKIATKAAAMKLGIPTPDCAVFNVQDNVCPLPIPVVVKPIHDGSSVGLHICKTEECWRDAFAAVAADMKTSPGRAYMIERYVPGRELTVGWIDEAPLPIIEITPADGTYDYEAKYHRDDTRYTVDPKLPAGVTDRIRAQTTDLVRALGIRHLARSDFLLDAAGVAWMLEVNTIPGFTDHSLVPMAARKMGLEMPALCAKLVRLALGDRR
jgi:D-alanine-D-alanine ligase